MARVRRKKYPSGFGKIIFFAVLIFAGVAIFFNRVSIRAYVEEMVRQNSLPPAQSFEEVNQASKNSQNHNIINQAVNIPIITNGNETNANVIGQTGVQNVQADKLPEEFNLSVPFTPQAPFAVWDPIHEDACEEASVMMVDAFYTNRKFTAQSAEDEINSIVNWETKALGFWMDTNAEETARILSEKYGYKNVKVVYDIGIDDIKREVAKGHPVILPAAGQLLGNKYFQQPGPLYHMLVVRGWTKSDLIITNDPGTKRGEGYLYEPDILINAVHDWNGGDVVKGRKVMIVVEK
jgi:hypothetical protein